MHDFIQSRYLWICVASCGFKSYPNFVSRSYRDDEEEKFMFDDPTAVYVYLNVRTCDTCNNVFRILDYLLVILTLQYNEPRILLE